MHISQEERLVNYLILHSNDCLNIGLLDGKMGIALVLFHYARVYKSREFRIVAEYLLDQVIFSLTSRTSIGFADGLTGIGWGIEYLIQNGYMKGDSADICEVIDCKLMEISISRLTDLTLDTGLEGYLHYLNAHIQGTRNTSIHPDFLHEVREKTRQHPKEQTYFTTSLLALVDNFNSYFNIPLRYDFYLSNFYTASRNIPPKSILGLRKGICGYIETMLAKQDEAAFCNR